MSSLNTKRIPSGFKRVSKEKSQEEVYLNSVALQIQTLGDYIDQLNKRWERLETRVETLERKTEGLGIARPDYDSKYKEIK